MDEEKKLPKECKLVVAVNLEVDKQTISDIPDTTWAWMKIKNRLKNKGDVKVQKDDAGEPTYDTKRDIFDMLIDKAKKKTKAFPYFNWLLSGQ